MATKSKPPARPVAVPVFPPTVPAELDPYAAGDVLPVPEVIEKDSDSVWALWSDAVKGPEDKESEAQPATQRMGLPELPKESDG